MNSAKTVSKDGFTANKAQAERKKAKATEKCLSNSVILTKAVPIWTEKESRSQREMPTKQYDPD